MNKDIEKEIHEKIKKDDLFMWSIKFEGEFDLAFYVWVRSIPDFSKKWFAFLKKYRRYILKQEIYESVIMVNYPMKSLVDYYEVSEKIIGDSEEVAKYDEADYEILKLVTKNARISLVDLADKLKMTPKAAKYRMKMLEKKKIIRGYNALIDTSKLDLYFYKIDFYLNDLSKWEEMEQFAKRHKKITYLMRTIGGPDFEIEAIVKNIEDLNSLIDEIKSLYGDKIEYFRVHRFDYTLKQIYLPGISLT